MATLTDLMGEDYTVEFASRLKYVREGEANSTFADNCSVIYRITNIDCATVVAE